MSNLEGFLLVNNDYILGEVKYKSDSQIIIDNVAQLMMQPVSNEKMGLALIPFIPFAEGKFTIPMSAVITQFTPSTQVINEYNRLFGSGIQIANVMPSKVLN